MDCGWTDSLGLALMGHGVPGRATEWARAAEQSGLGSVWIMEDYFRPGAYAVAAAAAAVSVRGVIGLGVVNPLNDVKLEAPPPSRVPIMLGVKGPRALALAAEIADGVHCSILASPAHVRRVRATTAGARGDFKVIAYIPVAVSDDGARARQWMRPLVAHYLGLLHGQSILEDAGIAAARSQPFREAFIAGRAAAADLVTNDLLDAVAIAGTPAECRSALERWAEAGLDAVIAVVPEAGDLAVQIERIGRELSPAWRQLRCR